MLTARLGLVLATVTAGLLLPCSRMVGADPVGLVKTWEHEHGWQVASVQFSPDGKRLLSGSADGTARVWTSTGDRVLETPRAKGIGNVAGVAYAPNGELFATVSNREFNLWDAKTGELKRSVSVSEIQAGRLMSVAFAPDGKSVAVGGSGPYFGRAPGYVWRWDVATGALIQTLQQPDELEVVSLAFSPDGKWLASGSQQHTVVLHSLTPEVPAKRFTYPNAGPVWSLAFTRDGKYLAAGGMSSTGVGIVAGKPVTVNPGGMVQIWSLDGRESKTLAEFGNTVLSVAFSPDGRTLATGSYDKTLKLWDWRAGRVEAQSTLPGWVHSVQFSPDGKSVASGDAKGNVAMWRTP